MDTKGEGSGMNWEIRIDIYTPLCIKGEGNGTQLQYSCLENPWTEEPGRLQSMGSLRVGHDWALDFHFSLSCIGEGNGNPLQYSCLENPRDGGAWWAAFYGVTQSRARLKRLSSSSSMYKTGNQWEPTADNKELYSVLCGDKEEE